MRSGGVSEQHASRVSGIRSFVAEVVRELAVRPLVAPLDVVTLARRRTRAGRDRPAQHARRAAGHARRRRLGVLALYNVR